MKLNHKKGFTLIELLVVIAIIALLASIVLVAVNSARGKARDSQRKADLKQMSTALELYLSDYGGYPSTGGSYYGEGSCTGGQGYTGSGGYIPNLAPTYIATLPTEPNKNQRSCHEGFTYVSNGTDYKLFDDNSAENVVPTTDPFYDPLAASNSLRAYTLAIFTSGARTW